MMMMKDKIMKAKRCKRCPKNINCHSQISKWKCKKGHGAPLRKNIQQETAMTQLSNPSSVLNSHKNGTSWWGLPCFGDQEQAPKSYIPRATACQGSPQCMTCWQMLEGSAVSKTPLPPSKKRVCQRPPHSRPPFLELSKGQWLHSHHPVPATSLQIHIHHQGSMFPSPSACLSSEKLPP